MFRKSVVRSSSLVAKQSFLYGVGRAIDLGGTFNSYNWSRSESEADRKAIAADWKTIGKDLEHAMSAE